MVLKIAQATLLIEAKLYRLHNRGESCILEFQYTESWIPMRQLLFPWSLQPSLVHVLA